MGKDLRQLVRDYLAHLAIAPGKLEARSGARRRRGPSRCGRRAAANAAHRRHPAAGQAGPIAPPSPRLLVEVALIRPGCSGEAEEERAEGARLRAAAQASAPAPAAAAPQDEAGAARQKAVRGDRSTLTPPRRRFRRGARRPGGGGGPGAGAEFVRTSDQHLPAADLARIGNRGQMLYLVAARVFAQRSGGEDKATIERRWSRPGWAAAGGDLSPEADQTGRAGPRPTRVSTFRRSRPAAGDSRSWSGCASFPRSDPADEEAPMIPGGGNMQQSCARSRCEEHGQGAGRMRMTVEAPHQADRAVTVTGDRRVTEVACARGRSDDIEMFRI